MVEWCPWEAQGLEAQLSHPSTIVLFQSHFCALGKVGIPFATRSSHHHKTNIDPRPVSPWSSMVHLRGTQLSCLHASSEYRSVDLKEGFRFFFLSCCATQRSSATLNHVSS